MGRKSAPRKTATDKRPANHWEPAALLMFSEEQSHLQVLEVMRSDGGSVEQNGAFAFPACNMCLQDGSVSAPVPPPPPPRQGWLEITSLQEAEIHHEACSGVKVIGGRFMGISGKARAGRPGEPWEKLEKY